MTKNATTTPRITTTTDPASSPGGAGFLFKVLCAFFVVLLRRAGGRSADGPAPGVRIGRRADLIGNALAAALARVNDMPGTDAARRADVHLGRMIHHASAYITHSRRDAAEAAEDPATAWVNAEAAGLFAVAMVQGVARHIGNGDGR
ncbi:hypothetical protein [Streptomyces aidingensis]|uniref:Uncharacterized protein n=1 Tax=Streptomyces aidingensis TaxID=910347 RepID=A0A1I1TT72_9ACTN|nr:hypothetical protein [Streptomyces aidingensis]SFD61724.1 hypothetical protein SAMN05421773_12118 [Streptomyces aidingensis]